MNDIPLDVNTVLLILSAIILIFFLVISVVFVRSRRKETHPTIGVQSDNPQEERSLPWAQLVDESGILKNPRYQIKGVSTLIGRTKPDLAENLEYLTIDRSAISRRHAIIEYKKHCFWLNDLKSLNGTFLNGKKITSEVRLKHGDSIGIHKFKFGFILPSLSADDATVFADSSILDTENPVVKEEAAMGDKTIVLNAVKPSEPRSIESNPSSGKKNARTFEEAPEEDQTVVLNPIHPSRSENPVKNPGAELAEDQTVILNPKCPLPSTQNFTPNISVPNEEGIPRKDLVDCTVFCRPEVATGESILVQVYSHLVKSAEEAEKMAKEFDKQAIRRGVTSLGTEIDRGAKLTFHLSLKGLEIVEPTQFLIWRGKTQYVGFEVGIKENHPTGDIVGKVIVSQNSIPIGHIRFKVRIIATQLDEKQTSEPVGNAKRYKYAFISYASEDRDEVLRRVQMLALTRIQFFQDILNIEPGAHWERVLYGEIEKSDVFYLFWSSKAQKSEWVRKEIKYALQRKDGEEDLPPEILPVVIEGPPIPAPPEELKHLHFGDRMLYFLH